MSRIPRLVTTRGLSNRGQIVYTDDYDINKNGDLWEQKMKMKRITDTMKNRHKLSQQEMREIARKIHEKIWVQTDGNEMYISEMSPNHLHNTIAMIRRGDDPNSPANREYIKLMQAQLIEYIEEDN